MHEAQRPNHTPSLRLPEVHQNDPAGGHGPTNDRRPGLPSTQSQIDTRYMNMLLAVDSIPRYHNILASFFTWILLAGFVLFPGTFSSLERLQERPDGLSGTQEEALRAVRDVPLFVVAFVCCGIGAVGMCYLWWKWMNNYVWLMNRIFLPGTLNSLAGIISTLVNIYAQQQGEYSIPSKITLIVTATSFLVCGTLTVWYGLWKLRNVRQRHWREMGRERTGRHGEGFLEKAQRKGEGREVEARAVV